MCVDQGNFNKIAFLSGKLGAKNSLLSNHYNKNSLLITAFSQPQRGFHAHESTRHLPTPRGFASPPPFLNSFSIRASFIPSRHPHRFPSLKSDSPSKMRGAQMYVYPGIHLSKFLVFFGDTAQEDPEIFTEATFNRNETSLHSEPQQQKLRNLAKGRVLISSVPASIPNPLERQTRPLSLFSSSYWFPGTSLNSPGGCVGGGVLAIRRSLSYNREAPRVAAARAAGKRESRREGDRRTLAKDFRPGCQGVRAR